MSAFEPLVVALPPEQVRERLGRDLLVIRSVWLPTIRDLERWYTSTVPLYVRWQGERGFEVGARLGSIRIARLAPVLRGRIEPTPDGGSRLEWRLRWSTGTTAVLSLWSVMIVGWAVGLFPRLQAGAAPPLMGLVWALLATVTWGSALAGWQTGRAALSERLGWLREQLTAEVVQGEDW